MNDTGEVRTYIRNLFGSVDAKRTGQIDAKQFQMALILINNQQLSAFSLNTCKLLFSVFNKTGSGTIGIVDFQRLIDYLHQWLDVFDRYDANESGHIDRNEMGQAFHQMGYKLSPDFVKILFKEHQQLTVDEFVKICLKLQRFTDDFRQKDTDHSGTIKVTYEDFIIMALSSYV